MISRIGLVSVWVSDQDAAIDFYVHKLGFEVINDTGDMDGFRWVEVAPRGAESGISLVKPFPGMPTPFGTKPEDLIGTSAFTFDTNDISKTYKQLTENGVVFTEDPVIQPWGRLQAQFLDQDGNHFILVERVSLRG